MRHARKRLATAFVLSLVAALYTAGSAGASTAGSGIDSYVAIGDSYSAGFGIPTMTYAGGCYRSTNDYPSILAASLGIATHDDVTCSGATLANTLTAQSTSVTPQFDALKDDTDLVTVGLGANQGNLFNALVVACPSLRPRNAAGHPCQDSADSSGSDVLYALADQTGTAMRDVLAGVHARSPHALVVVVGYPRLAPSSGMCAALPLAAGDYAYVNSVLKRLDDNLARAAAATGSKYVDMWTPSAGHDICARVPWVQGSADTNGLAATYHPFYVEQRAVAIRVAAIVRAAALRRAASVNRTTHSRIPLTIAVPERRM